MSDQKYTNALISETSPYLLQHAHNPVNWKAWKPEVLQKAQDENRLLLISIGYASCHWCHVMEEECFEDEAVADVMNKNFVNIKIDREERPDIDQIYMDALQLMTGSGGWPLNIVALPDGRPFWGATYVKKKDWIQVLSQLKDLYQTEPEKVLGYAENLSQGIREINKISNTDNSNLLSADQLQDMVKDWSAYFDTFLGGYKRAPKFMMPVNMNFLLHYGSVQNDKDVLDYVHTTLTRMAWGGIFDHVGGGFSRYAVDTKWHVPHFEKMLYDNGLLLSLYAKAYAQSKNQLYARTVRQIIEFLEEELLHEEGGYYSSLDADSLDEDGNLEEGAYYVWKEKELISLLGEDYPIFKDYYNINSYGFWEHDNYVLIRDAADSVIAEKHNLTVSELAQHINSCRQILKQERAKRKKPRLDDKILTSWNGLILKGLTDAYRYLGNNHFLDLALKNAQFITSLLMASNGGLFHNFKYGRSTIHAFLEDYAAVIDGFIGLYEVSFDERWIEKSRKLLDYALENFADESTGLFFFTSKNDAIVIRRTLEVADNVIPSSNSMMALNLLKLSKFYPDENYGNRLEKIVLSMQKNIAEQPQSHANWLHLTLLLQKPFYEVAIVGEDFEDKASEILKEYLPNTIVAATSKEGQIALLKNRFIPDKTNVYICEKGACKLPLTQIEEVLKQLR
ncbi:thioredoxin domain-containing protein [Maribacter aestuarii]|uniref:thioredoxin domain-containing protein n=1 Tax=Maribacter aestuarii TaxID=1130723 RepID=UPI0025A5C915|nr:thioredoxin domain-containing protein [Maribacter aestuarii]